MWLFMYICYALMLASYGLLWLTGLHGYFHFSWLTVNHSSFALLTVIIYLLTETLVMFFFIGTGISVKEYSQEHHSDPSFRQRMIQLKHKLFPPMMMNIFLVAILFIMGGAVDTGMIPGWSHGIVFLITIVHLSKLTVTEHNAFKENTFIILDMANIPLARSNDEVQMTNDK